MIRRRRMGCRRNQAAQNKTHSANTSALVTSRIWLVKVALIQVVVLAAMKTQQKHRMTAQFRPSNRKATSARSSAHNANATALATTRKMSSKT